MKRGVLLIEDNEQNRYIVTFLLEQHGYAVTSAPDGATGINLARRLRPDVILLDIQLPGLSGYDVARTLKGDADLRDVPIIAVTSHAMVGDREQALAAGCDGYIEKPIDPDTFADTVGRFLSGRV